MLLEMRNIIVIASIEAKGLLHAVITFSSTKAIPTLSARLSIDVALVAVVVHVLHLKKPNFNPER